VKQKRGKKRRIPLTLGKRLRRFFRLKEKGFSVFHALPGRRGKKGKALVSRGAAYLNRRKGRKFSAKKREREEPLLKERDSSCTYFTRGGGKRVLILAWGEGKEKKPSGFKRSAPFAPLGKEGGGGGA